MTTRGKRVTINGTTSDNEWQRVKRLTVSGYFSQFFFSRGSYYEAHWRQPFKPSGKPWREPTELRAGLTN